VAFGEKADKKKHAKLVLIGIKETARGTGAAAELMQAFRQEAARRGFERVTLVVSRDNSRARAAYEKNGWTLRDEGGESVEYCI
jgi:ribosomal protein S18 acetylase RimI-like enzyme